jgi:hypothetical protein
MRRVPTGVDRICPMRCARCATPERGFPVVASMPFMPNAMPLATRAGEVGGG